MKSFAHNFLSQWFVLVRVSQSVKNIDEISRRTFEMGLICFRERQQHKKLILHKCHSNNPKINFHSFDVSGTWIFALGVVVFQ